MTCNAWVARAYARVLIHLLLDLGRTHPQRCVTILEVGGGSGRLAFLVLREIESLEPLCRDALPPFRYVLSDVSEASLAAWSQHPAFAAWIATGRLDIAHFDLESSSPVLPLRFAGTRVDADRPCGPLVVIASYVLDALVQDAFRVRAGGLDEGRISLMADHSSADATDPAILDGLAGLFGWRPLTDQPYYGEPELDALLDTYRALLHQGAFGFPLGALRALDQLSKMSRGGLFLLSTDKAWNHPSQLEGQTAPYVMGHGSASMVVDHHAISRWVLARGGSCLLSSPRVGTVETALFTLGADSPLPLTRLAFQSELEARSPADFVGLANAMEAELAPQLPRILGLLRLGAWDPDWLWALLPAIEASGPGASVELRRLLRGALDEVSRRIFPLPGEPRDLPALLARAYAAAVDPTEEPPPSLPGPPG